MIPRLKGADIYHVRLWLKELDGKGILWHMDDAPDMIRFNPPLPVGDVLALATQRKIALAICASHKTSIFDLIPTN